VARLLYFRSLFLQFLVARFARSSKMRPYGAPPQVLSARAARARADWRRQRAATFLGR